MFKYMAIALLQVPTFRSQWDNCCRKPSAQKGVFFQISAGMAFLCRTLDWPSTVEDRAGSKVLHQVPRENGKEM